MKTKKLTPLEISKKEAAENLARALRAEHQISVIRDAFEIIASDCIEAIVNNEIGNLQLSDLV